MRLSIAVKSVVLGILCSVAVFIACAWSVYSLLLKFAGTSVLRPGSLAAILAGGVWAYIWGIICGAAAGGLFLVASTRYFYRLFGKAETKS
jgi:hypothetical protein